MIIEFGHFTLVLAFVVALVQTMLAALGGLARAMRG